jgi:FtsP/CotA-like multicopper oxidase with cupredoxin domain
MMGNPISRARNRSAGTMSGYSFDRHGVDLDRRRLLAGVGALALTGLAAPILAAAEPAAPVTLIAGRRTIEVNGRAASVFGIAQPDGTRGLYTAIGQPFRVTVRNESGADTLLHWHGLAPPYRQDGTPGLSGPPIPPGGTAQYDFPLAFGGTHWMHSHQGLQEQALMAAPLIICEPGDEERQEVVLLLEDFSFRTPQEILAGLRGATPAPAMAGMKHGDMPGMSGMAMDKADAPMSMPMSMHMPMKMDLNDVRYDAFLANDRTLADPQILRVERRGRVLLRIINGASSSAFRIDLGPVRAMLVAVDGHRVQPATGTSFPLAMGQRIDLVLDLPAEHPVVPVFAVLEGERRRTGLILAAAGAPVTKLPELADKPAAPLDFALEQRLAAATPLAAKRADRTHEVALTGSMAGYAWSLNGRAYGVDKPLPVATGERVELVMTNRSMMAHPMHLHGHYFQVVALDGKRFAGALRDTVLVPPMHAVTIAFDANNPGRWAFHCHNLYHMASGMMTSVQYETF